MTTIEVVEVRDAAEVRSVLNTIKSAAEHRRLLLDSMIKLVEGKMNVGQANALASLSAEVHKSIRQEFDMVAYADEKYRLGPHNKWIESRLLEAGEDQDEV